MKRSFQISPGTWVFVLVAVVFTLATLFVPRAVHWNGEGQADNVFKQMFGEGRKLFANESYVMADVYFHSGYYPSMFDRQEQGHDVAQPALGQGGEHEDSTSDDFLGPPPDWIAWLDRHFVPNKHTHLSSGGPTGHEKSKSVEEILPWLKLASDLNPQLIQSYTVGAYWLQGTLHQNHAAREFLLDGLKHNPGNSELQFDLGRLYYEGYHDTNRAYNVWKTALHNWEAQSATAKTNTAVQLVYSQITMNLAQLERSENHRQQAIKYLEMLKPISPHPDDIQKQIDALKAEAKEPTSSDK